MVTGPLDTGDTPLRVRDQRPFRLVQNHNYVAERIADSGASSDRDFEWRLHSLSAGGQELLKRLVHVIDQDVGLGTDMKMDNQFRVGFREPKAGGFIVPPNQGLTEPAPIKSYGCIEITHVEEMIVELAE
nr:hypothetical protein [Rhizobium sullae]